MLFYDSCFWLYFSFSNSVVINFVVRKSLCIRSCATFSACLL